MALSNNYKEYDEDFNIYLHMDTSNNMSLEKYERRSALDEVKIMSQHSVS